MKLLVIDDDVAILEVIKIIAEDFGYTPLLYEHADEVFDNINRYSPDIIFVDLMLNGSNGGDIIKKLKKEDRYKDIPTIILSANNKIENYVRETGADGFLPKPFDIDEFKAIVEKHKKK